ncbi:MAG: sulfur-oxidizing protein SoxX [Gammaproteobacteria bacterium]|jgi:sulfur-oxidizing protein SoxX
MMKFQISTQLRVHFTIVIFAVVLSACSNDVEPVKGFVLPEGNVERGKQVFATIGCRSCHIVTNEEFPPLESEPVLAIELGGKTYRVKGYGELLTSIVNPQHVVSPTYRRTLDPAERKDAKSPMPEFNDVMNVTQLIDLTTFLHSRYELLSPQYRGYYYGP